MLTKLTIRNFKRFGEVEIELGSPVVFVGPNNSGKTSALQALALWDIGLVLQALARRTSHDDAARALERPLSTPRRASTSSPCTRS